DMKKLMIKFCCFLSTMFVFEQATAQKYKSLGDTHHITIESPTNQINVGETIKMKGISNRGYKDFIWTSEYPGIASVENGKVTALDTGEVLIIARAKEDSFEAAYLLSIKDPNQLEKDPIRTTNEHYYNNPA